MTKYGVGILVLSILGCGSNPPPVPPLENAVQTFDVGQIWVYRARPGEPESRVLICRVESDDKLGRIVHIQVNGLRLKNKHAAGGYSDNIAHMPYSEDALKRCVTVVDSRTASLPASFEEGYKEWRQAFDEGKAGVWTLPLDEAISTMEEAMNQ
jgi:hypothetical protein